MIDANNVLVAASIKLGINDPTVANVLFDSNITAAVPPWDSGAGGFAAPVPNLADTSLSGLDFLSGSIPLGTFVFTGLKAGQTLVLSALLDPNSQNFEAYNNTTTKYTDLDQYVTGTSAKITVLGGHVVPEPSTLVVASAAGLCGLVVFWRRRRAAA